MRKNIQHFYWTRTSLTSWSSFWFVPVPAFNFGMQAHPARDMEYMMCLCFNLVVQDVLLMENEVRWLLMIYIYIFIVMFSIVILSCEHVLFLLLQEWVCAETGWQMLYQTQDGVSGHRQPKKSVKASKMLLDSSQMPWSLVSLHPRTTSKRKHPKIDVFYILNVDCFFF